MNLKNCIPKSNLFLTSLLFFLILNVISLFAQVTRVTVVNIVNDNGDVDGYNWSVNDTVKFGVIGDYGSNTQPEQDVADLIKSWNPDFITTVGDNNYPVGSASTIDPNIGQFFHEYIGNYQGSYGQGSPTNRFFPTPGHRD